MAVVESKIAQMRVFRWNLDLGPRFPCHPRFVRATMDNRRVAFSMELAGRVKVVPKKKVQIEHVRYLLMAVVE